MSAEELAEAVKQHHQYKNGDLSDEDTDAILEPFKFVCDNVEDMWKFCEKVMDQMKLVVYCGCNL